MGLTYLPAPSPRRAPRACHKAPATPRSITIQNALSRKTGNIGLKRAAMAPKAKAKEGCLPNKEGLVRIAVVQTTRRSKVKYPYGNGRIAKISIAIETA